MPRVDFLMVGGKLEQETMAARFYTRVRHPTLNNHAFQNSHIISVAIKKQKKCAGALPQACIMRQRLF